MKIEFKWNGSIAGGNHSLIVNGEEIILGGIVSNREESAMEALRILDERFNIDYTDEIEWTWGGRL